MKPSIPDSYDWLAPSFWLRLAVELVLFFFVLGLWAGATQ